MRVLVTGASGLFGAHLVAGLASTCRVTGVDREPWWGDEPADVMLGDVSSDGVMDGVMREVRPDAVVHCAAMVDVDACERDSEKAFACNAGLTRLVARSAPRGSLFVYVTTDGIFSGERALVDEEEVPAPRTVYGRSKLQGEAEVREATPNHLIIRTNFYGWSSGRKPSSAEWLYHALATRTPFTAFDDFFFTPVYVCDLVQHLNRLIRSPARGIFNLCGGERVSKYEFVMAMAAQAALSTDAVVRGSIDSAGLVAPRPKDMSLDCARAERVLGVTMPGCAAGLERFLAHRGIPLSRRFAAPEAPCPR